MFENMAAFLGIPGFARLDEFFEAWAYAPQRFDALRETLLGIDWANHSQGRAQSVLPVLNLVPAMKAGKSVAIIRASGMLMKQRSSAGGTSTIELRQAIRSTANSPDISGILFAIDSPGGTVGGTEDLANEIKAATKKKAVISHVLDEANSAAYWAASQADAVYANGSTALVGNIGALISVPNHSSSTGPKFITIASTPLKGAAHGEMTDDAKSYFKGIVDHWHSVFASAVQSGRRLTAAQLATVSTGATFVAPEALKLKLIDGIRPIEHSISELAKAK